MNNTYIYWEKIMRLNKNQLKLINKQLICLNEIDDKNVSIKRNLER